MKPSNIIFLGALAIIIIVSMLNAGEVEKKNLDDKNAKVNETRLAIIEAKAKIETTMNDLKTQRDALQQKIKSAKVDAKTTLETLKKTADSALSEQKIAVQKLKDTAKSAEDKSNVGPLTDQANKIATGLSQAQASLSAIIMTKDITD